MNPIGHRGSLLRILHVCSDVAQGPSVFSLPSSLSLSLLPWQLQLSPECSTQTKFWLASRTEPWLMRGLQSRELNKWMNPVSHYHLSEVMPKLRTQAPCFCWLTHLNLTESWITYHPQFRKRDTEARDGAFEIHGGPLPFDHTSREGVALLARPNTPHRTTWTWTHHLHFCSRDRETSRHCLAQWSPQPLTAQTPSCWSIGLDPSPGPRRSGPSSLPPQGPKRPQDTHLHGLQLSCPYWIGSPCKVRQDCERQ